MSIKINHILIVIVLSVLLFFFYSEKSGTYLDGSEIQVYLLITVTLFSLVINMYVKNDFLELLNFCFVGFYICRIPFLFADYVASDVISRDIDTAAIEWSITVLALQYLVLVLSILIVNPRFQRQNFRMLSGTIFKKILKYSFFIIAFNLVYALFFFKMEVELPSGLAILSAVFTMTSPLGLILLSVLLVDQETFSKYKYVVILNCTLAVLGGLYLGSKSSLLFVILTFILATVVVHGTSFIIRLRHVVISFLGIFLCINLYFIGQAFRYFQRGDLVGLAKLIDYISETGHNLSVLFAGISYRIGHLDFFIEKFSNPVYKPVVKFQYYFEAIVDKLTPGFDIFNTPFLSRALYNANFGQPSSGMNSEQITLFAESHLLFGYFSFLEYLLIIFFMKYAIQRCRFSYWFSYVIFYYYIVVFYYGWITSSGLDMSIILDLVLNGIFIFFSIWVIKPKVIRWTSSDLTPKYVPDSKRATIPVT
jgi:hypothetical protein